jgi:ABC-2 type transport system ATP-binding protein
MSVQKPTLDEVFLTLTGHGVEADDADATSDTDSLDTAEQVHA